VFSQPFFWDHNDAMRAFAARFVKAHGRPPTAFQASTYGAVTHYLKAIEAAGTDESGAVIAKMREIPINDFMTKNGSLRIDGRVIRDMFLLQAKKPSEAKGEWDILNVVETIPGSEAFRPLNQGGCPLVSG